MIQGVLGEALQPLTQAAEQAANFFDPEEASAAAPLLSRLSGPCAKLQSLMTGVAMTHAQVLLHQAPDVGAFSSQLKVCHYTPLHIVLYML